MKESVEHWIKSLEMDEVEENYIQKFKKAGYITSEDVENLSEVTENELITDIGVTKIGLFDWIIKLLLTMLCHVQHIGNGSCMLLKS